MKPLPQWVGLVVAVLGALAASSAAIQGIVVGFTANDVTAVVLGVCSVLGAVAHSLTGTGGKPPDVGGTP